ncbi:MAG: AAA family ATPase [Candidatus Rokubacteria bacterium]|nr:AAA family ATPase [Candidatus Rokubacteria bacterium]
MTRLDIRLFGGFQACLGGAAPLVLAAKAQAALAYLALRPGTAHPRDKIAALLWGATSDAQARANLRHTVFTLRKALGESVLQTEGHTLAIDANAVDVDASTFERLIDDGTPSALERAGEIYGGDLLDGLVVDEPAFEEWLLAQRERLRERAVEALAKLLAHQMREPATERAIQTAMRLLTLEPLQEAVHRTLMRLYARQGRRAAALKQYQLCISVLQRELGAEPEAETKQLYQTMLKERGAETKTPPESSVDRSRTDRPIDRPASVPAAVIETPMVGRERQRDRLRRTFDEIEGNAGRVVVLLGEAGIGKTTLVGSLAEDARARGAHVMVGRCHESERILPFGPWVDAFRAGHVVSDHEVLNDLPPVWRAELARLLPDVGTPELPAPTDDPLRLFESIGRVLELVAARRSLVVIIEDLHWADEMSQRLLAFLARRLEVHAVMLVATARDEEVAGAPVLRQIIEELDREPRCVQLMLPPLSRAETTALVHALARAGTAVMPERDERVWAVSGGNPFMVVETVRALDEGSVAPSGAGILLPERVRRMVAPRLERLSIPGRTVVDVAAALGRGFDFALVERASGLDESAASEGLEELVRHRVLHGVDDGFDFTHDRIREVAYGRLLPPRRKLLHAAIVDAIEQLHARPSRDQVDALAHHALLSEAWPKAVDYLERAATQASNVSAYRQAVTQLERALVALTKLGDSRAIVERTCDLRLRARGVAFPLGDFPTMLAHGREAERLAEALGDEPRRAQAALQMANYYFFIGDLGTCIESGERALTSAVALANGSLQVTARYYLGVAHHAQGDYRRAADRFGTNISALGDDVATTPAGHPASYNRVHLGRCLAELGDFSEAIASGDDAVRIAVQHGHPLSQAIAHSLCGFPYLRKGDLANAIVLLERAAALCEDGKNPIVFPMAASHLGYAYLLSGRVAEALPWLDEAVERSAAMGRMDSQSLRIAMQAEGRLFAGRRDDAVRLADDALALSRRHQERGHEAWALRLHAEVAVGSERPDVSTAEARYRGALEIAAELGMRPLIAHCHLGLGELYTTIGKHLEARAELTAATDFYRAMDMTFWLPRAEAALAR